MEINRSEEKLQSGFLQLLVRLNDQCDNFPGDSKPFQMEYVLLQRQEYDTTALQTRLPKPS